MPTWAESEMEDALRRLNAGDLAARRLVVARSRAFPVLARTDILRAVESADLDGARAAAREIALLLWPNVDPLGAAPGVWLALVGIRLFEPAVLERVLDVLSVRPSWAPTRWGYSEAPDRDLEDRADVVAFAEGTPAQHTLTLGRTRRVAYRVSLGLGGHPMLELRVAKAREDDVLSAFELLFELGRATGADFGWVCRRWGYAPPFADERARAIHRREVHLNVSGNGWGSGGPGGLAERTWVGPEYLRRADLPPGFPGVVHSFPEGVGLDLAPEPWSLRGPFLDHVWRRGMAHLAPSGLFADVRVDPDGYFAFTPGPRSAPRDFT